MRYTFSRLRGLPRRNVQSALKECCSGIIVPPDSRQWHLDLDTVADRNLNRRAAKEIHQDSDSVTRR
jgi:hypothetical protein